MINNRRTICILGGTGTVGVTACKVLSKLGYSLRMEFIQWQVILKNIKC